MNKLSVSEQHDYEMGIDKTLYSFTNKKDFTAYNSFSEEIIEEVFDFAYGMSFGDQGNHRNHRTGGNHRRRKGEIFADTFQGKLAEYALYEVFTDNGIETPEPDTEMYGLGEWDSSDFEINGCKLAVKSTKSFGQLLLLESDDWNADGEYIPNLENGNSRYTAFILIRLTPFASDILKQHRWLYTDTIDKDELKEAIMNETFSYDIPGCISRKMLVQAIEEDLFIPQGAYLGQIYESNKMDANNYYVQTGDMLDICTLIEHLKKKR
ncbi:hypothetical protein SAMN05421676_10211 [Salinibacillus kushneri]|uniref:Uncharacterized protein n=1 Tax=Salinibacillus kushneri TaxID=237682 RepID=A0A1I0A2C2_9BACI|nr:hypothetical protein [Salinibacillus kushneri]SES88291.1 hypothetical protein SAMN05421676_10211 [Salinibacillus kushneri]